MKTSRFEPVQAEDMTLSLRTIELYRVSRRAQALSRSHDFPKAALGDSTAGKTRAAHAALRAELPNHRVLAVTISRSAIALLPAASDPNATDPDFLPDDLNVAGR